jgi:DNA-directed RNA polymerase specialized sigma24 family protein
MAERTYDQQREVYRKQQATRRANAALKPLDPRIVIAATLQADGASFSEIGEWLGVVSSSVSQLLARARQAGHLPPLTLTPSSAVSI